MSAVNAAMLGDTDVQNIRSFIGLIFRLLDRASASSSSMLKRRASNFANRCGR
jgi:hypothetical protein